MVDSSVGGKTAINLDLGKNLVGSFWQPAMVYADISLLQSLPEREWACGCGEIVKSAVIDSPHFLIGLLLIPMDYSSAILKLFKKQLSVELLLKRQWLRAIKTKLLVFVNV